MRILWILKIRRIHDFLRILKMLMNSEKLNSLSRKITDRMEILYANVQMQLIMEEKQHCNASRANTGLLVHKMCSPKFKQKMHT